MAFERFPEDNHVCEQESGQYIVQQVHISRQVLAKATRREKCDGKRSHFFPQSDHRTVGVLCGLSAVPRFVFFEALDRNFGFWIVDIHLLDWESAQAGNVLVLPRCEIPGMNMVQGHELNCGDGEERRRQLATMATTATDRKWRGPTRLRGRIACGGDCRRVRN